MTKDKPLKFDSIGVWSEVKLEIVKEYARAYSVILASQPRFRHVYVDAFAGAGLHISRRTGDWVPGSPLNALAVEPPFKEYHLIDLDGARVAHLKSQIGDRPDVTLHVGDCNQVLLQQVFPRARYEDYRRALCLLDPYGLSLGWRVLETAGRMKSIEIFLNFPIEGVNRDALWTDPSRLDEDRVARMTWVWGDSSWREAAYSVQQTLFDEDDLVKRPGNASIVRAFRERLRTVAGFTYVPDPMPMRNSSGAVVYYLFFASHNAAGDRIARHIFRKYRNRGLA
jgi:three-Cys-motif partner protein